jgi:hypothetical protein
MVMMISEEGVLRALEALGDKVTPMMEWEIGQYLTNGDLPAAIYLIECWEAIYADDLI